MDATQIDLPPPTSKRTDSSSSKNGRVKSVNGGLELVLDGENGHDQSFVKPSYNLRAPSSPAAALHSLSTDPHSAALLPINLNSELNMVSAVPTEKGVSKVSAVPQRMDKESSLDSNSISPPVVSVKGEEERETGLISESQESIDCSGAEQESCCTNLTSESVSSPSEIDLGSEQMDAVRNDKDMVNTNTTESAESEEDEVKGDSCSVGTSPSVLSTGVSLTCADQDISKLDSSVGSTSTVQQVPQEEHWDNISIGTSVPNSEMPNHAFTPEESKLERSISLDPGSLHKLISFDKDDSSHSEISSVDEARIRAELEMEIERDLEREIKAKIMILNKRLEELHKMQSKRSKHGHNGATDGNSESEEATAVKEVIREVTVLKQALKNPLKTCDDNDIVKPSLHREAASAKRPSSASGRRLVPLNGNHNETTEAQKRWAKVASNFVPPSKAFDTSPLPCCDHKHGSKIWPVCPRHMKEERVINTRPKKFDWTQTLRPDVPTPPGASVRKFDVSPNASEAKEAPCGNTKRTLFPEECLTKPAVKESQLSSTKTATVSAKNETANTPPATVKPRRSDFMSPTASSATKVVRKPFISRSPSPVPRGAATPVKTVTPKPATPAKQSCDMSIFRDTKPSRNAVTPTSTSNSRTGRIWK